jgi:pathogenesis-related protein 1
MYKKVSITLSITLVIAAILTASALQRSYAQADNILQIHNTERDAVGVPPLSWSPSLAADAQSFADYLGTSVPTFDSRVPHCSEVPSCAATKGDAGENIAWGTGAINEVRSVEKWAAEKSNIPSGFSGASYILKPPIGHYTQMVWKDTREVGCGASQTGELWFFVCRYSPAGNWRGEYYLPQK